MKTQIDTTKKQVTVTGKKITLTQNDKMILFKLENVGYKIVFVVQ